LKDIDAVILDMDGVITKTAKLHAKAWKKMFDEFLEEFSRLNNLNFHSFDIEYDYSQFIDGIPRYDGIRNFLQSRNISLPEGDLNDGRDLHTIKELGNKKNSIFQELLKNNGIELYEDTLERVHEWKKGGLKVGVISSSKNCRNILSAAGIIGLFDTLVDGISSAEENIKGKPHPDIFLKAAENLKVEPIKTVVVEDAILGVEAGKTGGFKYVIGVDRSGIGAELKARGADLVVKSLKDQKVDIMFEKS
jgi:trehalose 6-phosphate phosphatase